MPSLQELGFVARDNGLHLDRPPGLKATRPVDAVSGNAEHQILHFERRGMTKRDAAPDIDPTQLKVEAINGYRRYASNKVTDALATSNQTLRKVGLMNAAAVLEEARTVTPGGIDEMHRLHTICEAINALK